MTLHETGVETHSSPWRTIWFSPRRTIRRVVDAEVPPSWAAVVALAALHQALASIQLDPLDGTVSLSRSTMPVILGVLQLAFGVLVGPFLLAFAGGWLGGEADAVEIRHAVAWSYVPFAVAGLFWIPVLVAFGGPPGPEPDTETVTQGLSLLLLMAVPIGLVWSLVFHIITLAEVQRFSILRAIASVAILLVPLLLLRLVG